MSDSKISVNITFDVSELLDGVQAARQALDDLSASAAHAGQQAASGLSRASEAATQAGQRMQQASAEARQAANEIAAANGTAQAADQGMGNLGSATQGLAGGMAGLYLNIAVVVASTLISWVKNASAALLEAQINAERLQATLTFAAGGGAVKQEMAWLGEVTNRLGLEANSTAESYGKWAVATRDSSIAGAEAKNVFEAVAHSGNVMALSTEGQRNAMTALTQMMSDGAVKTSAFNQLNDQLPMAMEAGALAVGKTTDEFKEMLESGEIIATDFLPKLASELNTVNGSQDELAQTTEASLNRASNAWTGLKTAIADAGAGETIVAVTDEVASGFENMAMRISTAKALGLGAWGQFLAAMNDPFASVNADDVDVKKTADQNALSIAVKNNNKLRENLYKWSPSKTLEEKQAELNRSDAEVARLRNTLRVADRAAASRSAQQAAINSERAKSEASVRAQNFIEGKGAKHLTDKERTQAKIKEINDDTKNALIGLEKGSKEYIKVVNTGKDRITEELKKSRKNSSAGGSNRRSTGGGTNPSTSKLTLKDINERIDAEKKLAAQFDKTEQAQEKLTEGEEIAQKLREEKTKATPKRLAELEKELKAAEELGKIQRENMGRTEAAKLNEEFSKSAAQRVRELQEINEEAAKEVEWVGLSTEARAVAQAQWELEKTARKEILALQEKMTAAETEDGRTAIKTEIENVRTATSEKSAAVAAAMATKTAASEATRISQDIEKALTDGFLNGFKNGKTGLKFFQDYISSTSKGWAVKILIRPVMEPINDIAKQITTNLSKGMQEKGGGLENLSISKLIGDKSFGGIGKMSIGDAMGSWYPSDMLQSFSQSGIGEFFGLSNASGALTQAGADLTAGMSNLVDVAGSVASWATVGMDALNAFKTGEGWGKTVGSAIGTYILPGIGTTIGSTLGGMIDDAFGGKGGPKSGGNANAIYGADGQVVAREMFGGYTPNEMDTEFKTAVDGIQAQYATMVKSLGGVAKDLTINLGGDADPQGDAGNRISAQIAVGQIGAGMDSAAAERALWDKSVYSKISANTSEDLTQAVKDESSRMLVAALKASDLPADIASAFNSIDVQNASIEQINAALTAAQGIMALTKVFDQFATVLPGLGDLSLTAKNRIISLSGGLDGLSNNLTSYQQGYFSAQEREDATRAEINKTLADANIKMPQTRAEFRALLEGLDKTTESGAKATAALLAVNSQFAGITLSTEDQDKLTSKFKAMGSVLPNLAAANTSAQLSMLKSAGGLDTLTGQLDKFSESFVSQKDREAAAYAEAERVLKSLGVQMPLTQQGFVEIVRGYELSTSAGVDAVSSLLGVAGTIAKVTASADDINKLGMAFSGLERLMPSLAGLTTEAQLQLAKLSGGADVLSNNLSSFKSNYFTKAELERDTLTSIEATLAKVGISLPKSRDEFKALVGQYSKTSGDFATAAMAALLSVQEQFFGVTQSSDELTTASSSASSSIEDLAKTIQDEFDKATAAAGQSLTKLKEATAARNEVDQWLAISQGQGAAWQEARSRELWGMVSQATSPEQQLELLQELKQLTYDRYKTEIDSVVELTRNADRLRDAAHSIRDYVQSLKTGELSPRTMGEQLAEAGAQFSITLAQAKSGDKNAIDALQGKAQTYLQLGQNYYGSAEGYAGQNGIFNNVTGALDALGISMDAMAAGQDLAAAQAEAQARYSAAQIAEMQRLRTAFSSVETALRDQFVQQSNTAAQILAKMRDDDQLAVLKALPAELAALIKGAWVAQGGGSAGSGTAFGGTTTVVPTTPTVTQPPAAAGGTGGQSTITSFVAPYTIPDAVAPTAVDELRNTVSSWYMAYLGRPGDSAGIDYWTAQAKAGGADAAYQSFAANAAIEKEIGSIYTQVLGRMPDQAGWAYWVGQVKAGVSYDRVAAALAASDEAKARLPQFGVGAEWLPSDMIAQLHAGEAVIPAWANTRMLDAVERGAGGAPGSDSNAMVQLRADVQRLIDVNERQGQMIERLLSALGRAVLDSSADNAARIVDGVAAAGHINNWRAGAGPVLA